MLGLALAVLVITGGEARAQDDAARGDAAQGTGAPGPAEAVAVQVAAAEEALAAGNGSKAALNLIQAGNGLLAMGDADGAGETWQRAIEVADAAPNPPVGALARGLLGDLRLDQRRFLEARELLTASAEHIAGLGIPAYECFVLETLGMVRMELDDLVAAEAAFEQFAAAAARVGDASLQALAASRRARARAGQGDATGARALHVEALDTLGPEANPYYAVQVRLAAGQFHESLGEYDAASDLYDRAREILPAEATDVAVALYGHIGNVRQAQGRYGAARACLDRVADLCADGTGERFTPELLRAQAKLAHALGDLHEARRLLDRVLDEGFYAAGSRGETETLLSLALVRQGLDERPGAVVAAGRALLSAPDDDLRGRAHRRLGDLEREQGDFPAAIGHLETALELARERGDRSDEALALGALGYAFVRADRDAEGAELADQALRLHEQLGETGRMLDALHTLALVAVRRGDDADAELLLARATSLLDAVGDAGLGADTDASVRSHYAALGEVAQDLTVLRAGDHAPGSPGHAGVLAQGLADAGRWKGRALLEGLAERLGDQAAAAHALPASGPELVSALGETLGPGRALIEYVEGDEQVFAYVLGPRGLALHTLGPTEALQRQADDYVTGISEREQLFDARGVARHGQALADVLLTPLLATLPDDVSDLALVPTAALARLPFEALVLDVDPEAGRRPDFADMAFVADRFQVTYGPSSPVLLELARRAPRGPGAPALVVGDPIYASELRGMAPVAGDASSGLTPARFVRLPGTRTEALAVARHVAQREPERVEVDLSGLTDARSGALSTADFTLLLGAEASRARLLGEDLSRYGVIHLAAHGHVDPRDPRRSGLVLSNAVAGDADGLADNGGLLGLADISGLRLDADLVVLSACDSARGRVVAGEGVQSLARAFLQAGARSVVASLWQVQDEETSTAMEVFYAEQLQHGRSPAEAARRARLSLRHGETPRGKRLGGRSPRLTAGHPYLWAPFIWIGALPDDRDD